MGEPDLDDVLDRIDEIEIDLPGHGAKVDALGKLAATLTPGTEAWAEVLVIASDHQVMTGDFSTAIAQLELVRDSGVTTSPSVEAHLLTAHLAAGHDGEVAELDRALRQRSRDLHLGGDYSWVGDAYEEAGQLDRALRWFSMANRDVDPDDLDVLDEFALAGRFRVRQQLGLPEDAYDLSYRALRPEAAFWDASEPQ